MFRAEDTSRANYRSLFEYAAGAEARLAQDRRLAYYEQVLPEMLTRVKGLPLMYQTYSKQWTPESPKDAFWVKRRVPDLSKPIYITDDDGNKIQKGFETQDLVMETDEDIPSFMTRKGRFKGQHGFNKGFSYLAPIYHVERDQMPFVLVDLDIDRADFSEAAWNRLLTAVTKVYDWFRLNGFDPLINFTGSSFHIWAKDGQVRSYAETKLLLEQLSKEVDLPLAAGAAHIKGQITIDYPQNKYRAPLRFPLSIHGDTGLASIIIPRNQLRKFDPLTKAHPDQVLKQLPNHLAKIDAWFSDLPQTKPSAEAIITAHLDTLNEDDLERCMWGDCGVLADELMAKLQAAGYTDAVYEIGRAYIHPFEEYDDKTFIGGHVVVTVDGVSYDALGAGAKQRWVDGPVIQEILAENGFSELGPLLSSHLTVSWITSTWDEVQETRRHNFAGKLVDFESEMSSKRWYSSGNVHPWQLFLDTETLSLDGQGERDNYPYEDMKVLESKYGLKPTSAVIWVSAMPEVAASYMIGQGLLDTSDEEVKDDYGFSKSDLETTEFGQVYYPPHVDQVGEYQGTIILETDDGDGGYLLSLNRDYTGRYGLKRIGMAAETEYKKKRQKPTPEPGVEGGTDLKPSRRKPPMKVKGSDVYSVQKHRADKRGSHRDIRIGLDGKLLSFVPVGRYEKKDEDGKWQKTDGSRLPKKIGEGVSVIRTEDHPFDYWWFEGEIPKDSYGAGPVSLETHGTRRIIEWIPDEKLKVEFIGGKYAGTYTFERSKKSKDGKVWWMRKSRPVPKDKTDKKTKKAEITDNRYGKLNFNRAFSNWKVNSNNRNYSSATHYIDKLLDEAKYTQGKIILYRALRLANPEDFDPTETGESWTPDKNFAEPYFGYKTSNKTYILTALVPAESVDWKESVARAFEFGPPSDEKEIVLKRGAPIELINLPMELSFAIDATPEALIRATEELERFVDESGKTWELRRPGGWVQVELEESRETFIMAFAEWSEKFQAGALPLVAGGLYFGHTWNQDEPTFKLDSQRMIRDAFDLEPGPNGWSQMYGEWIYESISQNTISGNNILPPTATKNHMQEFWNQYWKGHFTHDVEVKRQVDEVNRHYIENAIRYVENLLMMAGYAQGKIILYRAITLINPEDFDPTNTGQSWTPDKSVATPYFGHMRFHSRKLGILHDSDIQESNTYILKALVPIESIDWYTTVLRALVFGEGDEKEIVLKTGAPIELVDVPFDLSFAIDGTPEALIRAAEEDDEDWWFTMNTPLGPDEEFGPYDSHDDAMKGIERVMQKVISLQDGYTRDFPRPYQGRRGSGFGLRAEDDGGKSEFEQKYLAKVREYEQSEEWYNDVRNVELMDDETFYYTLERRLEYLFPDVELPLSQKDYEELKSANPNLVDEERSIARSISDDMLDRVYDMLFARQGSYENYLISWSKSHEAEYRDGKILLYREITMNSPEDLDTARAGIFWTPVLQAAKAHWGGMGEHFLLQALVDFEDINWKSSWYANLIHPEECEIRIRQGAKIELLPLTRPPSRRVPNRQGEYVYPEELVFEIEAPNPNILAVERGTKTELLEAIKDLPEEYRRLIGIYPVEPQPTQTGFASEDIDLTVGEAFDKALAEIQADVEAVQPRSKDLSEVTLEDYEKTKQVYQRFMIPAGITGSIIKDEWYYETEPIYLWSDMFKFVDDIEILRFGEWRAKIDAQESETERDIFASNEINYAFYWFAIVQINSIYNWLLSRLGERKMHTGVYAGPPVELPEIIESQRDATDIEIYRWLATSQEEQPVRRLRNRMRPVDVNYYGGYSDVFFTDNDSFAEFPRGVRKGLQALSYGPCWSLSPDAYTRTDQWKLAQEAVIHKMVNPETGEPLLQVGISYKHIKEQIAQKFGKKYFDVNTYVIEKSIPASGVDWYSTLISSALWGDSPEYEVIPKRGVFLSEEITDSSDFEQEFNRVETVVSDLFKEFSWWSDNQKELHDVSDLHDDEAGRKRLRDVESHLAMLTRPGSLLWSSGDDSAYDAYPADLRNPEYIFQDSGIFVDEDGEFDGFTDEERGETYEEGHYFTRPFEESPDLDIRLRYAYTLNRLSKLAEQYFSRLRSLRNRLEPQFASGEVTLYRAFSLPEGEVPQLRRMTIFPLSMRIGDARRMENKEQRVKYNYESYGAHWSLVPGFEWSDDFPSHYGKPYIMEKQIPYTDVDWFTTLLVMAYGREPEWEVAVNENVFLAENEVKIPLYHVTPLDQVPNILETGLEPRIGPRSEAMELEPRVYLFGDQESVEQALMNWLGDEMYGAEWRSGYAVLRIDLPADWFKQRRVEKTFDPYGSERSWEWSTSEKIPGEFIEVIDKWTWSKDELVDFQADFGMPVYGKYLRDARNQAELDLSTISDDYKYFHLSWDRFVINQDGETFTFTPRVPEYPFGWMSGSIEDDFTPRVSLSSTVKGCLEALPEDSDGRWYVYGTKQTDNIISVRDYFEACPDDYGRSFEMIKWINSLPEEDQLIIKNYDSPWTGRDLSEIDFSEKYAEINVSDLPPKYRDLFYGCVPDAMQHDEYWSLEPITMDYLGYVTWETLQPEGTNDWLYLSAPESTEIKYPLRLYHGTSVRNWRAIQSSGELRTGCLASSHGYDIDMPDTYIDLAIGEIEDNHPDIKAGGLVLEVVFPDQATANQYLQADTTMYDLGMAVLEDDLYTRYAPADWQPEDAQEGWYYGSWDWFETDFQDLVKSNQATKTIPYSPQDLSDWQASYLSVYSVCIKKPIPLKYITVDWGSESRRAEEETFETVGEAWDKALVEWYEIVDWAKHEREKGFRDVSTTELQQAIEVYNILNRVSNKISEYHFLGGSMDETVIEQLIRTYASDDLELQKTLIEHYEELHILTIPYVVKSKTMNYFFYYGIIEWIIMMTSRLNSLNSYGGKELDDAISSQFQESTLKAYRWISVGNDGFPSRNMNFNNYADFSYGAHWSLHPEVYTWTTEWEGVQYQKDYLIEKDVPVEDIDWFETLISCLFFLDSPELEIIMKPMTFIAETIDEPHLYLDMDGCFADFAGAITQRVNDVLQVQDVSEISSKSLRRAARKAKELGITSVTERDFDLSLSHDPINKKVIDRMLYKIASEPGFFYNLEVMNRDVLDEIIASGRPFSFLSAPIGGTKDYSIEDKRAWVRDRLGLDVTVNVVPREEKVTFCQPGDVLIDDHVTTISEWTAAGGHGVLFPQEIDEFLRKPYNGGTTTYQAEEVEKVKQYPIVYKKNATGTLQQWQVLLLPQESGGYLLTTASGKVGGKITQGRGKLIKEGKVNRTALEQAELQADSKFKKKKDEGYFPTKEEAHQNLVLLPMKALDFKKRSHDITYPAVAQRKFDGVRCLAIPQADGSVRLMSRTGKTWTHLHHLQSQIEALNLDSNMVLDGEVYSDTLTFEDATGLVRRQTLKPGDEEKMKQIDYRLYDAILLDNPNATFLDRYSKLAALFPPASSTEGRRMGHLVLTENFPLRNREDLLALHRQFTTDEDFEGVMVRNLHGTYDINKRSKHLQKFKEFQDAEYKIVGYNEASGDWQGTPIWICEMADGRQFNVTPTGDRPSRIEMFNNIEDYMGKLLTVKFFELTADGVPRHGVGLAIRDYE